MSGGTWRPETHQRKVPDGQTWNTVPSVTIDVPLVDDMLVDELSPRPTRTYGELTLTQAKRFDAQLAAWRAACALAGEYSDAAAYGLPMHDDRIEAWIEARAAWERTRTR